MTKKKYNVQREIKIALFSIEKRTSSGEVRREKRRERHNDCTEKKKEDNQLISGNRGHRLDSGSWTWSLWVPSNAGCTMILGND